MDAFLLGVYTRREITVLQEMRMFSLGDVGEWFSQVFIPICTWLELCENSSCS